jgi:hypothetical protein
VASLSDRLKSAQRNPTNKGGCVTCKWWATLNDETKKLINAWLDAEHSNAQLYEILTQPSDDTHAEQPLRSSNTGFRLHLNHHNERCR